jgi:hypothetical protein
MFEGITKPLINIYRNITQITHVKSVLTELYISIEKEKERYKNQSRLIKYEHQVFSQSGEDGIIEEIFNRIGTTNKCFVEFGVQDGLECNSTYLLLKEWKGLWIEGSEKYYNQIKANFSHLQDNQLKVKNAFITAENIENLFDEHDIPKELDMLSIDIDGNDYYVWAAIKKYTPRVVVIEYNATMRPNIEWIKAYDPKSIWDKTMHFNASLKSLELLGLEKGYKLIGCNFHGTNAFFVRNDLIEGKFNPPFNAEFHYEPARYYMIHRPGHKRKFGAWNR